MIGTYVTTPMPTLVEAAAGARALSRIFSSAEVPEITPEAAGRFMPQRTLLALLESSARVLGVRDLGLLYGPRLNVADWGPWGAYVRGAATLEGALRRTERAMPYHVSMDTLTLETHGDEAFFVHRAALAGCIGYHHYAPCAAAAMVNLIRAYTGPRWTPTRVEFDLPLPASSRDWEAAFACPVMFGSPRLTVIFPRHQLADQRQAFHSGPVATMGDLRRLVRHGAPRDFISEVTEIARLRLLEGRTDIDGLARQMVLGPRTLQRRLSEVGLGYRDLVGRVRMERALDLLRETDIAITEIAGELGYASPSHFTRAFRRETGRPPSAMRAPVVEVVSA
jgi:AraC-like DNA-binding protein